MRFSLPEGASGVKAARSIARTGFLNVWEGAVRSGKTVLALYAFSRYVRTSPETSFLMSGRTVKTIEKNAILDDFGILRMIPGAVYRKVGESRAIVFKANGTTRTILVYGAADVRAYMAIRGATFAGWYADEINMHDREFVSEALRRTAVSTDRRHFWTLNPDNPNHWIYKDYLDRYAAMSDGERQDLGGYHYWHFTPLDNPAMTERMYASLCAQYPQDSYLFRRYILGERCNAEGLIYDLPTSSFFRDLAPEMWESPGVRRKLADGRDLIDVRYCGIDFGADHPTVMTFGGFFGGTKTDFRIVGAYYDERSGKTTYDHYLGFLDQCSRLGADPSRMQIAIDPAAKVLRDEFLKHGLTVIKARNDVLPGISFVRDCLALGRFVFDNALGHHREEFGTYSWDPKAGESGIEKPIKTGDDCMDSLRYLAYTFVYPLWR